MIASAQKVEQYEIGSYGSLRTWVNPLGKNDAAVLLEDGKRPTPHQHADAAARRARQASP